MKNIANNARAMFKSSSSHKAVEEDPLKSKGSTAGAAAVASTASQTGPAKGAKNAPKKVAAPPVVPTPPAPVATSPPEHSKGKNKKKNKKGGKQTPPSMTSANAAASGAGAAAGSAPAAAATAGSGAASASGQAPGPASGAAVTSPAASVAAPVAVTAARTPSATSMISLEVKKNPKNATPKAKDKKHRENVKKDTKETKEKDKNDIKEVKIVKEVAAELPPSPQPKVEAVAPPVSPTPQPQPPPSPSPPPALEPVPCQTISEAGDMISNAANEEDGGDAKLSPSTSMLVPEEPREPHHPLNSRWTLWYLENDRSKSWEDMLHEVTSFDTVENFWSLVNHIKPPSEIKMGSDYCLFKKGIRPMWEDEANVHGGRWVISLNKNTKSDLDNFWMDTMLCLIGEACEHSDELCGAVVNIRAKSNKISIWTADGSNEAAALEIGRKLREGLRMESAYVLQYQLHKDTMVKQGSTVKSIYTL